MDTITLVGPKRGDLAHVTRGSGHLSVLEAKGWRPLASLGGKAIRAMAPAGLKFPPRIGDEKLAGLVTAAFLAGGKARWPGRTTAKADSAEPPEKE